LKTGWHVAPARIGGWPMPQAAGRQPRAAGSRLLRRAA